MVDTKVDIKVDITQLRWVKNCPQFNNLPRFFVFIAQLEITKKSENSTQRLYIQTQGYLF